jgi:hypothetical protein
VTQQHKSGEAQQSQGMHATARLSRLLGACMAAVACQAGLAVPGKERVNLHGYV